MKNNKLKSKFNVTKLVNSDNLNDKTPIFPI